MGPGRVSTSPSAQASFNTVIGNATACTRRARGSWRTGARAGSSPRTTTRPVRRSSRRVPGRTRGATPTPPTTPTSRPPTPQTPLTQYENYLAQQLPVVWQPNQVTSMSEIRNTLHGVLPRIPSRPSTRRTGTDQLASIDGRPSIEAVTRPRPRRRVPTSDLGHASAPAVSAEDRFHGDGDDRLHLPTVPPGDRRHPGRDADRVPPGPDHPRRARPGPSSGPKATTPQIAQFNRLNDFDPPVCEPVLALHRGHLRPPQPRLLVQLQPGGAPGHRPAPAQDPPAGRARDHLALVIAIPLGILQVVRRNKPIDYVLTGVSFIFYAMPVFLLGHAADPLLLLRPPLVPGRRPTDASTVGDDPARSPRAGPARVHPGRPHHRLVQPVHAVLDDGDPHRGLRPHGPGQRGGHRAGCSTSTRCATP